MVKSTAHLYSLEKSLIRGFQMVGQGSEVLASTGSHRNLYGIIILILLSSTLASPFLISWISHLAAPKEYHGAIMLKSETVGWHNGTLTLTYQDGSFDIWIIDSYYDNTVGIDEDNPLYGYINFLHATRNFTESETCRLEYHCIGLDLDIGPIAFDSITPQILYEDLTLPKGLSISWFLSDPSP